VTVRIASGFAALLVVVAAGCGGQSQPAGPQLVYAVATDIDSRDGWIWQARADGSHAERLTRGAAPQISPDGRWIAFVHPQNELHVIASSGGKSRLLRRVVREHGFVLGIVWSPTSRQLASIEAYGFALVDLETGRARPFARGGNPSFSPNGRRIVYERADSRSADLYVFDTRTGRTRRLTHDRRSGHPLWGPRWIAFSRYARRADVLLVDPSGRKTRPLTHTRAGIYPAAWSADGQRLLAANPAIHNGRLWAVDVPSGRARDLTGWVGDLFPQGLSRDGRTILAAIGCGGMSSPFGVVEALPFAGGKPRVLVKGPCRASWNR
jgi:Tol biopolymer transport system component